MQGPPSRWNILPTIVERTGGSVNGCHGIILRAGREFAQLRTQVINVPAAARDRVVAALARNAAVERANAAVQMSRAGTPDDPEYIRQWALPAIAWDQVYGERNISGSATIAVLDTGVDASHPDLAGVMTGGQSFVGGDPDMDPNGHGTALAGIAAAANNGAGIAGVAYAGASVLSVQVLGADGTGWDSDVVAGVLWAADNGAQVILMGFSSTSHSPALADALAYAWSKGAVLVAATGNGGSADKSYPAGMANVIGVAATDADGNLWSGSNTGSARVAAPGVSILAPESGGGYETISGTSAASAHAAGLAALLVAGGLDNSAAYDQIVGAVEPVPGQAFGRIDVAAAFGQAVEPPPPPDEEPSPPGDEPPVYEVAKNADVVVTLVDASTSGAVAGATVTATSSANSGTVIASPSNEGSAVTGGATFTSPPGKSPWTCTVDYGDGTGPQAGTVSGAACTGPSHTYADDGAYTVTVVVTDKDGGVGSSSGAHTVNNVAPTLALSGAATVDEGTAYTLSLASGDPGADTITSWTIDWGDATQTVPGNPAAATHVYPDGPNSYTAQRGGDG